MNSTTANKSFERIRASSLLYLKADLALIAGLSTLDLFWGAEPSEAAQAIAKFSFLLGYLLVLIGVGVVLEYGITLIKTDITQELSKKNENLRFEMTMCKFVYATQVLGHIGFLGVLHGYLLSLGN